MNNLRLYRLHDIYNTRTSGAAGPLSQLLNCLTMLGDDRDIHWGMCLVFRNENQDIAIADSVLAGGI